MIHKPNSSCHIPNFRFGLAYHSYHCIISFHAKPSSRKVRRSAICKTLFYFATRFLREALVGLATTTPVGSRFFSNLDARLFPSTIRTRRRENRSNRSSYGKASDVLVNRQKTVRKSGPISEL